MAKTREQLIAERDLLNDRLGAGVVRVAGADRSVQYDLAEARRRRDEIAVEIAALDAVDGPVRIRQVRMYGTRGY